MLNGLEDLEAASAVIQQFLTNKLPKAAGLIIFLHISS
jgi:hypothetical protein